MDASLVQQKPHLLQIEEMEYHSRYNLLYIGVNIITVALKIITTDNMEQIMNTTMTSIPLKKLHSPKQKMVLSKWAMYLREIIQYQHTIKTEACLFVVIVKY